MKKTIFFILINIFSSIILFSQAIDLSDRIKPVFVYDNHGGYFYVDEGDLTVFEAIFKKTNHNQKPQFIGYNKLYLFLNDSTVFLNYFPETDFKENEIEIQNLIKEGRVAVFNDNNRINFKYQNHNFELEYNNLSNGLFTDKIYLYCRVYYRTKYKVYDKTYILLKDNSYLAWHKVFNNYLILACHSQGGSGHVINLEMYDLDKMIKLIK